MFHNGSDALKKGALVSYPYNNVVVFKRVFEQKEALVIVNVRNETVIFDVPAELENSSWKDAFNGVDIALPAGIDMSAYEYRILTK